MRPLRRIARVADAASKGALPAGDFPEGGAREVSSIVISFTRMRRSVEKAMHLLEAAK